MKKNESGSLTLEMSIVLPLFIFIFMFIFGFFNLISVQNKITHAAVQAVKSVSLDPYLNERGESYAKQSSHMWADLKDFANDLIVRKNVDNSYFASKSDWYKTDKNNTYVISRRFEGYFSGGDIEKGNDILKSLGVKNGFDGINFTVNVDEKNVMTVRIQWEVSVWFDFLNLGTFPMEQTLRQKLWLN